MTPTGTAGRAAVVAVAAVVIGLLFGRADVVGLAAPFLLGSLVAAFRPPAARPAVSVDLSAGTLREGQAVEMAVTVTSDRDIDAAVVTVHAPTWRFVGGAAQTVTAVTVGRPVVLQLRMAPERWGRRPIGPVTVTATGPQLLTRSMKPATVAPIPVKVLPAAPRFEASDPTPRAVAYSGLHRSRSTGPGAEFAAVRPFQPSDTPRRINWRASLRAGTLQANTTYTDRASRVMVVIDSKHAAGPPGHSSLDLAVRAGAAIAEHYVSIGDSVGLIEYGGRNRILDAGLGRRHLALIHEWLVDVGPLGAATPPARRWLASLRISGAVVIVLTPLLDEEAAAQLVTLRSRGAALVAIDCLPAGAIPAPADQLGGLAQRVWSMEREMLTARLAELGVPVVAWAGSGTLDQVLAGLARVASAPRAVLR